MSKNFLQNPKTTYILLGTTAVLVGVYLFAGGGKEKKAPQQPVKTAKVEKKDVNDLMLPPPPPPPSTGAVKEDKSVTELPPPPPPAVEEKKAEEQPQVALNEEKEQEKNTGKTVKEEKKEVKPQKKKEGKPNKINKETKEVKKVKKVKQVRKPVYAKKKRKNLKKKPHKEVYIYSEKKVPAEEFVRKVISRFNLIGTVCYNTAERDCVIVLGAREVKEGQKVGDLTVKSVSLDKVVFVLPDGREYSYPIKEE